MKFKDIATDLGCINGRDAIVLVKVNNLTESKMDITFSIDTTMCSKGELFEEYVQMRIISNSLIYFKMQHDELLPKFFPKSCLCEIINSQLINDNLDIQPQLKHILLTSYDAIFEFVCSDIEFLIE